LFVINASWWRVSGVYVFPLLQKERTLQLGKKANRKEETDLQITITMKTLSPTSKEETGEEQQNTEYKGNDPEDDADYGSRAEAPV
jgi:hypothetical protein